jgi:hypothetical protein
MRSGIETMTRVGFRRRFILSVRAGLGVAAGRGDRRVCSLSDD